MNKPDCISTSGSAQVRLLQRRYAEVVQLTAGMRDELLGNELEELMGKYGTTGIAKKMLGDEAGAREALLKAKGYAEQFVAAAPDEAKRYTRLAECLAWLGEKEAAIAEAKRGIELLPESVDAFDGPVCTQTLAEVYMIVGEYDQALPIVDGLLSRPSQADGGEVEGESALGSNPERPAFHCVAQKTWWLESRYRHCALVSVVALGARRSGASVRPKPKRVPRPASSTGASFAPKAAPAPRRRSTSRFSPRNRPTVRVIDNPAGDDDLAAVMRRTRGLAGVNGGYFDPQNAPVGLVISDGKIDRAFPQGASAQRRAGGDERPGGAACARRNILRAKTPARRCNAGRSWWMAACRFPGSMIPGPLDGRSF